MSYLVITGSLIFYLSGYDGQFRDICEFNVEVTRTKGHFVSPLSLYLIFFISKNKVRAETTSPYSCSSCLGPIASHEMLSKKDLDLS